MRIITLIAFSTISLTGMSQTTAQDWMLTDCASGSHTLFNYLDAEEVVVMEFGMGCGSCYAAADGLYDLKQKYAVDQPGKVNFFYMDYWSGNTCSGDVDPVLAAHPLDAGFIDCSAELSYYMSGMPMPAVVIVGGSNHAVLFEKSSFSYTDTTNMITAIDNFFATLGTIENEPVEIGLHLFPNPAADYLTVESNYTGTITILDLTGKVIYSAEMNSSQSLVDITAFSAGQYLVELRTENGTARAPFIK